jgi:hypothetical protein
LTVGRDPRKWLRNMKTPIGMTFCTTLVTPDFFY